MERSWKVCPPCLYSPQALNIIFKLLEKAIRQNDMVMLSNNQYQLQILMRFSPVPQYPDKEIISSILFIYIYNANLIYK